VDVYLNQPSLILFDTNLGACFFIIIKSHLALPRLVVFFSLNEVIPVFFVIGKLVEISVDVCGYCCCNVL
jgi:hypothetical protein